MDIDCLIGLQNDIFGERPLKIQISQNGKQQYTLHGQNSAININAILSYISISNAF